MNRHQVSVAAESFVAGAFAQAGYSVFVQYGANQPGYDLVVSDNKTPLHISVKGSTNGAWFLTTQEKGGSEAIALDLWSKKHAAFIFAFVQFQGVALGQMPRIYVATGREVHQHLKIGWFGRVSLTLIEKYSPNRGKNKGKMQQGPDGWLLTNDRLEEIFKRAKSGF
jgi:hypothetical protein